MVIIIKIVHHISDPQRLIQCSRAMTEEDSQKMESSEPGSQEIRRENSRQQAKHGKLHNSGSVQFYRNMNGSGLAAERI